MYGDDVSHSLSDQRISFIPSLSQPVIESVPVRLPLLETDKTDLVPRLVPFAHSVGATYSRSSQYYAYAIGLQYDEVLSVSRISRRIICG